MAVFGQGRNTGTTRGASPFPPDPRKRLGPIKNKGLQPINDSGGPMGNNPDKPPKPMPSSNGNEAMQNAIARRLKKKNQMAPTPTGGVS